MVLDERKVNLGDVDLNVALEFLNDFFSSGLPKEHRKDLKKWRYYVINEEQYQGRHGAGHVLAVYEETIQLIEAANQFLKFSDVLSLSILADNNQIEQEKIDLEYFPKNLSVKRLFNPLIGIKRFFKELTLDQYKDLFHEWLRVALSNKAAFETLTAKEIIDIYENLRMLYSAAWLIHQRVMVKNIKEKVILE